jgi:PQ loop repeat
VDVIATLPVLAAGFAVPQFIPQITKLHRTNDTAGLSTSWALLTGINNAAWFGYFPASSAALLGGYLGLRLSRRPGALRRGTWILIGIWALLLAAAAAVDRRVLGALLTGAFLVQIVPAVSTAYRTRVPTGIARGTWLLILAETACWALFGTAKGDIPLVVLGATGVISALLMLIRARSASSSTERSVAVPGPDACTRAPSPGVGVLRPIRAKTDTAGRR